MQPSVDRQVEQLADWTQQYDAERQALEHSLNEEDKQVAAALGSSPLRGEVGRGVNGAREPAIDRNPATTANPSPSPSLRGRGI
jgi:hypothetical protein